MKFFRIAHMTSIAAAYQMHQIAGLCAGEELSTNPPIVFHVVQADEPAYQPYVGTTFVVSNLSNEEITVSVAALETNTGIRWITASRPKISLVFSPVGGGPSATSPFLAAHQAAFFTIYFLGAATNAPPGTIAGYGMNYLGGDPQGYWRLRLTVAQKLKGVEDIAARIRTTPELFRPHAPGMPLSPYSKDRFFFGKPVQVLSPEILGWYSTLPPIRRLTNSPALPP